MGMICLRCGFQNPPGMRFCGNCGARLAATSALNPNMIAEGFADPADLGVMMGADLVERLQKAGVEARGQRRNVSVLFADISGYTALSGRIDSEDLFEIVQKFIQVLSRNVYKYEGIIDKLTGDGIMALFGAPISHENNAERAVRAAIDMQIEIAQMSRQLEETLQESLKLRVGIHSGSVIVGGIGTNLMMDYTAIGDTVNLARRIEEASPSGAVLISEAVYRHVRAFFNCQQVSVLNAKGITQPVIAYRVVGPNTRPSKLRGIDNLRAPMVGRNSELLMIKQVAQNMLKSKRSYTTIISGEAGIGKSRLKEEFTASLDQSAFYILEGSSLVYRHVAYWVFREILFSYLKIPSNTPVLPARQKLSHVMYRLMGDEAKENLPFLEHLMGLPYSDSSIAEKINGLTAEQLREQIYLAMQDFFFLEAKKRPIILVLDDFHWADQASIDLLRYLLESLHESPIHFLIISRIVEENNFGAVTTWAEKNLAECFRWIELEALKKDEIAKLLYLLISIPKFPSRLSDKILERSSGNPLFLEETLRMLIDEQIIQHQDNQWVVVQEGDTGSLGIPTSLLELVLARFDRLDTLQRFILQIASVIGKDFSMPVLSAVTQKLGISTKELHQSIDQLLQREYIFVVEGSYDSDYSFRHILMSDAIYSTMLRKERNILHGEIADTIESLYANQLDEQIDILANHYRWSPNREKALHYLILAGQKADRNQLNEQSRNHYEEAYQILSTIEHKPFQAYQVNHGLGDVHVFCGEYPEARKFYKKATQILINNQPKEHIAEIGSLFRKTARTYERQGNYDEALQYLSKAEKTIHNSQEPLLVEQAEVWNDIAWIHFRRGNFLEAGNLLEKALVLALESDSSAVIASIYNRLAGVAYNQGDWDNTTAYLRESIKIRESSRDLSGLSTSFNNLAGLEIELGQLNNALENLIRSNELKKRLGQTEGVAMTLNNLGWLQIQRGEFASAKKYLYESYEITTKIGYTSLEGEVLKNLGELFLTTKDWVKAEEKLKSAIKALKELNAVDQLIDTYRLLGELSININDSTKAIEYAKIVEQLTQKQISKTDKLSAIQQGEVLRFRGMLAIHLRNWDSAKSYLRESKETFQKLSSRLYQGRTLTQMGFMANKLGEIDEAKDYLRKAEQLFLEVGAKEEANRVKRYIQDK